MPALMQILRLIGVTVIAFASFTAQAQLTAGKDYQMITPPQPVPPGKNVEVIEFFWYGCPHCADLQPSLKAWLKKNAADIAFHSQPAAFNEGWTQLARTYYAIDVVGESEKLHGEVFNAIHKNKKLDPKVLAKDPKTLFAWVGTQKVDVKKFTDAYNSFSVVSKTQRTIDTTSAYGISGTPSLAIDGRFLIAPHMVPAKAGNVDYEQFFKNVDQLITMARANRKGK
ncbi:MAG TPA: thiol:disulfide interchange protein DsbA/DsbL [Burkholderiales bacterium]|nr:thiol:disulfide interchange protein DsbA/DsbL [Burkholderiales bacterium]